MLILRINNVDHYCHSEPPQTAMNLSLSGETLRLRLRVTKNQPDFENAAPRIPQ
jgi:hypothetical protein